MEEEARSLFLPAWRGVFSYKPLAVKTAIWFVEKECI
jgi:hypothetical protein